MTLQIGQTAPDFELANQWGQGVKLSDFRGKKSVALVFFPLAFSGTCTGELCELRDNLALFAAQDVELIGVSVDSKYALRAWGEQEGYDFQLLADFWPHGEVAAQYGAFLPEKGFATRATVLIDKAGVIRAHFVTAPGEARQLDAYRAALAELEEQPAA
ncbi:peroxiredoxin [Microterricola viridarii]|uniref:Alkyl hydroperoxide reductase E n=1 Tax=Microterricola viridarii TaxID=412690 RepID=A0A1H1V488_9MICO|nr:peroxiredoxin [Microterricola viridarii]SDS79548.1 Peroxiredoxin [Microterricola viridarii]